MNPVRVEMVDSPCDCRWSSHWANAMRAADPLLTPHPSYLALGGEPATRQYSYRLPFDDALEIERLAEIRAYLQQQRALGSSRFQADIEEMLGRCVTVRSAHRPSGKCL